MNATGGYNASLIVTTFIASRLIRWGLALLVRVGRIGVIVAGCTFVGAVCTRGERLTASAVKSCRLPWGVAGIVAGCAVRVIAGTLPGLLLHVCRLCDLFVMMRFRLAVGSRVFMIAGTCDTLDIVGVFGGCVAVRLTLCSGRGGVVPSINALRCRRSVNS